MINVQIYTAFLLIVRDSNTNDSLTDLPLD